MLLTPDPHAFFPALPRPPVKNDTKWSEKVREAQDEGAEKGNRYSSTSAASTLPPYGYTAHDLPLEFGDDETCACGIEDGLDGGTLGNTASLRPLRKEPSESYCTL